MSDQKTLEEIVNYINPYLNEGELDWIREYMEVGEGEIVFDSIVKFILEKKVPLTKELHDWIHWYGNELEKISAEISPDWKKIKLNYPTASTN